MLSTNLIERFFNGKHYDAMLDGLLANGLELPLPIRAKLGASSTAVVALGLRRLRQLTYGPTDLARRMTRFLVENTHSGARLRDPLTASAVAAALNIEIALDPQSPDLRQRAMAALSAAQQPTGLFAGPDDHDETDHALTTAFTFHLLAGDDVFRSSTRFFDVLNWFDEHSHRLDQDTANLWRLGMLDVNTPSRAATTKTRDALAATLTAPLPPDALAMC